MLYADLATLCKSTHSQLFTFQPLLFSFDCFRALCYFYYIKEIGTLTSIDSATASDAVKEVARYGINGQLLNGPTKGMNIVKYSDGTTKCIVVK